MRSSFSCAFFAGVGLLLISLLLVGAGRALAYSEENASEKQRHHRNIEDEHYEGKGHAHNAEPLSRPLPKSRQINWAPLPEIQYQFRADEPRPPAIVSDTFAVLCAAPLLLLFVLVKKRCREVGQDWGVNFGRFPISLWAVGFHVGLIGVFGLYTYYWLKLNMFQTLKWLSIVGLFTFVCGNRLLRSIDTNSQKK